MQVVYPNSFAGMVKTLKVFYILAVAYYALSLL